MINNSLWLKGIKTKASKKVTKDIETDILIIGGGITGLSTAYFLKDKKVTLIDKGKIGYGKTSFSTGKLTYLQDSLLKGSKEKENLYISSQIEAIEIIKNIIIENGIKCNYESNSSFLYATNNKEKKKILKIEKILNRCNIPYKVKDNNNLYNPIYSIKVDDTAVINPAKYILGLKEVLNNKIDIYENSFAHDFDYKDNRFIVHVNDNYITAKILVVATHYPFLVSLGLVPFKTYIEKSYLVATKTDKNKKFNAITQGGDYSIRYYSDPEEYMIFCSCSNKLSKNMDNEKIVKNISWEVKSRYNSKVKYIWSNTDVMSPDLIPLSGPLDKNIYIATGYSTWGLTNGTLSAKVISDHILNVENKYTKLLDPNRMSNKVNIILNNFQNAKSFIISKIVKNYSFYRDNVEVYTENGIRYGKYIDENNEEHIVYNKCPHMKCNLIFNSVSKTWDCPCHSSRFDIDGNIICGPANYSIKVEKK